MNSIFITQVVQNLLENVYMHVHSCMILIVLASLLSFASIAINMKDPYLSEQEVRPS